MPLKEQKLTNYQTPTAPYMNKNLIDQQTFNAFKEGHVNAYKLLFYDLYEPLVAFSTDIVKNYMVAEDLVIEAFQKMSPNAYGKNTYSEFRAAIYTAVRNRSINHYNRRMKREVPIDEMQIAELSEDSVFLWTLKGDVIKTIKEEIDLFKKDEDKLLAEYLIFRQLSPKKVAELLGMNEQTVRNKKSYLINRFINALKRKGLPIFILF